MGYSSPCRQLHDRWHGWGVSILRLGQANGTGGKRWPKGANKTTAEMRRTSHVIVGLGWAPAATQAVKSLGNMGPQLPRSGGWGALGV